MGQSAWPDEPETPRKLLHDSRPAVRLSVTLALAKKNDIQAIPVLIDLLAELSAAERDPVEKVLRDLAGAWAPNLTLVGEDDISRRIRRDAWASWWQRTDGATLLEEFRKRTLTSGDLERIETLIRKLGDKSFRIREQAMADLTAYGNAVVPRLREVTRGGDLERRLRAERCLAAIVKQDRRALPPVAARLLALRKPPGAVETLLGFLPWADDDRLAGEVHKALTTVAVRDGKADPALVRALGDVLPSRRAIAAEILVSVADSGHRAAVRKLLVDPDPTVRLAVAVALVYARERDTVPVLIDLASELPPGQARHAEELLERLAGARAPALRRPDDEMSRKIYRAAWQAWWKEHGAAVNLAQLENTWMRKIRVVARASNSWDNTQTPDKAFDNDRNTTWNAGDYAPQWIEAELGASTELGSISAVVTQSPAGATVHEVWLSDEPIGESRTRARLAHTFQGNTDNNQMLKFVFTKGTFSRHVQIRTTQSPSWVAWVDVELQVRRARFSWSR